MGPLNTLFWTNLTLYWVACHTWHVQPKFWDHQKDFLWASRLWVGRRKEPILGYVPKNYVKKNSCSKVLTPTPMWLDFDFLRKGIAWINIRCMTNILRSGDLWAWVTTYASHLCITNLFRWFMYVALNCEERIEISACCFSSDDVSRWDCKILLSLHDDCTVG